jgi:hypothetical protein
MSVPSTLIPLSSVSELREAGICYPRTVDAWRWLYRCRVERGLDGAFVRIGRRILVDAPKFIELARAAQHA